MAFPAPEGPTSATLSRYNVERNVVECVRLLSGRIAETDLFEPYRRISWMRQRFGRTGFDDRGLSPEQFRQTSGRPCRPYAGAPNVRPETDLRAVGKAFGFPPLLRVSLNRRYRILDFAGQRRGIGHFVLRFAREFFHVPADDENGQHQ